MGSAAYTDLDPAQDQQDEQDQSAAPRRAAPGDKPLSATAPTPRLGPRAALAGATGALASVAIVITLGVLALAPLGDAVAGITAAFFCVTVSAAVFALLGRSAMPVGGPTSATVVIVASLVAALARSPARPADATAALAAVLAAVGCAVMLMGALQLLMAAARLGRFARLVPQPVLAGFMNGVALLIVVAQVPALLALAPGAWAAEGAAALRSAQPGAVALGLGTAALAVALAAWRPRWPAALLALGAAIVAWQLAHRFWPGHGLGATLPPLALPDRWTGPAAVLSGLEPWSLVRAHPGAIALAGGLLALVGSLEALLNIRALDQQLHTRHDENRELRAMGIANLLGGAIGALPMLMLRARAASILQAGGRGRGAALGAVALSLALLLGGGQALALLPQAALGGLMLVVAASLVDRWTPRVLGQLRDPARRATLAPALATMAAVALTTVGFGPGAGVAAGVVLATAVFLRRLRGHTLRWQGTARSRPSRRVYPPAIEQALDPLRAQIALLELEGALFWGNVERVADHAEAVAPGTRFVVLDLRRVVSVDESVAVELHLLARRLADRGASLLLAGPAGPASAGRRWGEHLAAAAGSEALPCWPDADRAVEHAEQRLLADHCQLPDLLGRPVPLRDCGLLHDLSDVQWQRLQRHLVPVQLQAGEALFREGDAADALYVLTRGSVSVSAPGATRYVSFSPGTELGELALLDGGGRSADAVADQDAELHGLSQEALARLADEDPVLAATLYRRIAGHLAQRLRSASAAWREAAG